MMTADGSDVRHGSSRRNRDAGGTAPIPAQLLDQKMTKLKETKTAFAARTGVSPGRISQLIAEGLPVRGDGSIDVEAGLSWMSSNLDAARRGKGGSTNVSASSKTATLAEARRLHEIVKVQRAKLAYEREQGSLVDAVEARNTIFARARAERDAYLAWVQRVAPILAAEAGGDPNRTFAILDRMMREHLAHLAETPLGDLMDAG
jgi:hypothetical protein